MQMNTQVELGCSRLSFPLGPNALSDGLKESSIVLGVWRSGIHQPRQHAQSDDI